ncbi:cation-translocating P-type ATPase [Lacticaseibacillus parakribbianus]|uniref:cation-translocating P-type ATPase n=1 Tax=Lacticaseibacillus parakribbianus TaxID=2970927 RepID=UPI0021CB8F91|nr:cation-transporting P-type ATPase [Lacticaseibacillus parakribbianus]
MSDFYHQHKQDVLAAQRTDRTRGLTAQEAASRLQTGGPNALPTPPAPSAWRQFAASLKEPLVIILFVAVALALGSAAYDFTVTGDSAHGMAAIYEAVAILLLIAVNAGLGFWQAQQAEKSLAALKTMNDHHATVLRDGEWAQVPAETLVPGDIVTVKTGDFIEADLRFLHCAELAVNESHLTGEAEPILKQTHALDGDISLGDRTNMGYSGSMVTGGNGLGVVVATGRDTELGRIAKLLTQVATKKTPIERTIAALTRKLMAVALAVVVATLGLELAKAYLATGSLSFAAIAESLSTAIALAVAAIPDALPAVLSIVLTIGATMLAKNRGLIKSLNAVETLGATSFIASDKTGTLTQNQMTVTRFWANGATYTVEGSGLDPVGEILPVDGNATELATATAATAAGATAATTADAAPATGDGPATCTAGPTATAAGAGAAAATLAPDPVAAYRRFVLASVLNNEAAITEDDDGKKAPYGNPTDVALVVMGHKAGIDRDRLLAKDNDLDIEIVRVLPFDSTRKMMSVVIKDGDGYQVLTKGAPDVILAHTDAVTLDSELVPVATARPIVENQVLAFAEDALRTIAVTLRDIDRELAFHGTTAELEEHLTLLGVAGIIDPPRPEVRQSVAELQAAGVAVVMITGDHAVTARAIAVKLGIVKDKTARVVTGQQLAAMSDDELYRLAPAIRVYARVSPEHKQRIVTALQRHQEVVAMTGDGINDAPALRAADIGIAMGINGTEVTKDAADLILLDDKFTTIENSVRAGRTIFGNIQNFMRHELTTNVAEVLALLFGVLLMIHPVGAVAATTPTLTALMVLWVNMVSDALPSFALGYDVPEADLMQRPPRDVHASILEGMLGRIFLRGIVMGGLVYLAFLWAASHGATAAEAQTLAFLTLVFGQLWHVFDARSQKTLFRRNPFANGKLLLAVGFAAAASLLVTLLPFFNAVMGTAPLSGWAYAAVIILPALPTFALSGLKELWWRLRPTPTAPTAPAAED